MSRYRLSGGWRQVQLGYEYARTRSRADAHNIFISNHIITFIVSRFFRHHYLVDENKQRIILLF